LELLRQQGLIKILSPKTHSHREPLSVHTPLSDHSSLPLLR
jgi:hypothetical protein